MRRHWGVHILSVALLALLAIALLAPLWAVVRAGFVDEHDRFTLEWFRDVVSYRPYLVGLGNSLALATCATMLCLLISIPLALLAENYVFAGRRGWLALVQVPMILPPFVGAIGIKALLSRNGGLNLWMQHLGWLPAGAYIDFLASPFWSCVVLEALYLYPITFLNVQASLANIDPSLHEAASNLGARGWRRFWRITLPLMRPGIFAGATVVFIWAFSELGTPLMVGLRDVTAVQVFQDLQTTSPSAESYALVVVMLGASVALYLVGKLVLGRAPAGMLAKATVAAPARRLRGWALAAVTLPFAVVFVLAVLPHVAVVLGSLTTTGMLELSPDKWTGRFHAQLWQDVLSGGDARHNLAAHSVLNSLKYTLIATVADLGLGFAIAYLVVRRKSWLTGLLDTLAMLPLAVPGLVLAFGYFVLTQGESSWAWLAAVKRFLNPLRPPSGAWLSGTLVLLVVAYTVRRLPLTVRSCAAGLEQTSVALEEAAANLGAGPLRTLWRVTVPLLAANLIAGGLLVFSRSMLEVSDSLILAVDRESYPMTKAIYDLADNPNAGMQMASALGVWGMVLLAATILGASLALGKRLGALFRV
jgi:iron(III) transport system permease protein